MLRLSQNSNVFVKNTFEIQCTPKVISFSDKQLLEYIEFHSRTPAALFSKEMAERFFALVGRPVKFGSKIVPMPISSIKCDLEKAWQRLSNLTL